MIDSLLLHRAAIDCRDIYGDSREFFRYRNDEWYVDEYYDATEITIRGSDTPVNSNGFLDWMKNLNTSIIGFRGYEIASGFNPSQLMQGLEFNNIELDPTKPIILKGHSRGAGLAKTAAISLNERGYRIKAVICFGSPRISKIKYEFPWDIWNYSAWGDPVPSLPFWPPLRWKHWGTQIQVGSFWSLRNMKSAGGFRTYSRAALNSHLMPNYIDLIKVPNVYKF